MSGNSLGTYVYYYQKRSYIKKKKKSSCHFEQPKIGGQLGLLPHPLFFIKIVRSKLWESHLEKKMQISFYLFMRGEPKLKHALIQKRSEIK